MYIHDTVINLPRDDRINLPQPVFQNIHNYETSIVQHYSMRHQFISITQYLLYLFYSLRNYICAYECTFNEFTVKPFTLAARVTLVLSKTFTLCVRYTQDIVFVFPYNYCSIIVHTIPKIIRCLKFLCKFCFGQYPIFGHSQKLEIPWPFRTLPQYYFLIIYSHFTKPFQRYAKIKFFLIIFNV